VARIDIDTSSPAYRTELNRFRAVRDYIRPSINMYQRLPKDKQERWLEIDPLMHDLVELSNIIVGGKADD